MIAPWPQDLSLASFERALPYNQNTIYRLVFTTFANQIQVQREEIAVPNLEKIFNATFSLSSKQSFHAMSLRDLSRETGISMGGLYNYIGSKEELAQMIEVFMDNDMVNLGLSFIEGINAVRPRLETILRRVFTLVSICLHGNQKHDQKTKGSRQGNGIVHGP